MSQEETQRLEALLGTVVGEEAVEVLCQLAESTAHEPVMCRSYLERAEGVARELGQVGLLAQMFLVRAEHAHDHQRYDVCEAFAREAARLFEEGDVARGRCEALLFLAFVFYYRGHYALASRHFADALEVALSLKPREEDLVARCHRAMGANLSRQGRHGDALVSCHVALGMVRGLSEPWALELASMTHHDMAHIHYQLGDIQECIEHMECVIALDEQLVGGSASKVTHLHNLGRVFQRVGEVEKAIECFERCYEASCAHPNTSWARIGRRALAHARQAQGRLEEALALVEATIAEYAAAAERINLFGALLTKASLLCALESPKAEEALLEAEALAQEVGNHGDHIKSAQALHAFYKEGGRWEEALLWHEALLARKERQYDETRSRQVEELKVAHQLTQKEHEAELYRVRTQELREEVARQTQEIREARDRAHAAAHAKSVFLAITSHELRTPLSTIIGYSELLQEELDELCGGEEGFEASAMESLEHVLEAARHLLGLIDKLLQLSQWQSGSTELRPAPFFPGLVLREVSRELAERAQSKENAFVCEIAASLEAEEMFSDEQSLREIAYHLVENALKFTHGGVVTLRAWRQEEALVFEVEDTGMGLDERVRERLFEPFEQSDLSSTRSHEGLGLGLALCRHRCDMLKGTIQVTSVLGEGSVFAVSLPWGARDEVS